MQDTTLSEIAKTELPRTVRNVKGTEKSMSRERDIAYGLHSNIPMCCILFFVDEWDYTWPSHHAKKVAGARTPWGYVPCPACLTVDNRVHIKMCEAECGRQCWKDF